MFATNADTARPSPFTSSAGSRWPLLGGEHPHDCKCERHVARALAVAGTAHLVDPPDRCRIEADPCRERKAAAVHAPHGDAARAIAFERVGDLPRGRDRIERQPERTRQHARPAARNEGNGRVALEAVERLVEAAVAGEHDDRVRASVATGLGDELGGMFRMLGLQHRQLRHARELTLDRFELLVGDARRERIDDEDGGLHGTENARADRRRASRRGLAGRVAAHPVQQQRREAVHDVVGLRARAQPGVGPVHSRERKPGGSRVVEIGAKLAPLTAFAEECAKPLLVAAAFGHEGLAAALPRGTPLAREDRRDVELLGDHSEMPAQRGADPLDDRPLVGHRVERQVNASEPSRATSQSRSAFPSMCE